MPQSSIVAVGWGGVDSGLPMESMGFLIPVLHCFYLFLNLFLNF